MPFQHIKLRFAVINGVSNFLSVRVFRLFPLASLLKSWGISADIHGIKKHGRCQMTLTTPQNTRKNDISVDFKTQAIKKN